MKARIRGISQTLQNQIKKPQKSLQFRQWTIYALTVPYSTKCFCNMMHTKDLRNCQPWTQHKGWSVMKCDTFPRWNSNWKLLSDNKCETSSSTTVPSSLTFLNDRLYVVGGLKPHKDGLWSSTPSNRMLCYDFTAQEWWKMSSMRNSRHHFGMTSYNGNLYVIGGQGEGVR